MNWSHCEVSHLYSMQSPSKYFMKQNESDRKTRLVLGVLTGNDRDQRKQNGFWIWEWNIFVYKIYLVILLDIFIKTFKIIGEITKDTDDRHNVLTYHMAIHDTCVGQRLVHSEIVCQIHLEEKMWMWHWKKCIN